MGCFELSSSGAKKSSRRSCVKIFTSDELQTETGRPITARRFPLDQIQGATMNFGWDHRLGEGDLGVFYRGRLQNEGQYVAIKRVDWQWKDEFLAELENLSRADHPNIIKLVGYCCEREEMLVVYEYMSSGSLTNHLYGDIKHIQKLNWNVRVKIAAGVARALKYLHYQMKPRMIHRDIKCGNIFLDEEYNPKLSNFGLVKLRPTWLKKHVSITVEGTLGYRAPEYSRHVTSKNDVYSFGVVLLQIFTGRPLLSITRLREYGVSPLGPWAQKLYKGRERNSFLQMADPTLEGQYPKRGLHQVLYIAVKCVEYESKKRPSVDEIVKAFDYIESQRYDPLAQSAQGSQGAATSSYVPQAQSAQGSHGVAKSLPLPHLLNFFKEHKGAAQISTKTNSV